MGIRILIFTPSKTKVKTQFSYIQIPSFSGIWFRNEKALVFFTSRIFDAARDFEGKLKIQSVLLIILLFISSGLVSQTVLATDTSVVKVVDAMDVLRKVFKTKPKPEPDLSAPTLSFLPVIGYNPSFGAVLGFNAVMGRQFGNPANTTYSVYTLGLTYGSKGILTGQLRHNIFKPGNTWNWQGNYQISAYGLVDYGLGTGNTASCYSGFNINDLPTTEGDSSFPVKYKYLRLFEKGYRKIAPHIYLGAGLSFDIYRNIDDLKLTDTFSTPSYRYNLKHGFDPENYSANGILLAFQFNTREHPIRSYGGIYFDLSVRFNQKWMGSSRNSIRLQYDFRKYWSLSTRNPEHVLAIWHWASYDIGGVLPYLEMPATGTDTYNRSGRAYTIGYFRGPSYAYFETEYRYPITRNKLISGVIFVNAQTAGDDAGKSVYTGWNFGGGAGLRVLFQKKSRSALCIDFSKGDCGSSGIFFGLNEVF